KWWSSETRGSRKTHFLMALNLILSAFEYDKGGIKQMDTRDYQISIQEKKTPNVIEVFNPSEPNLLSSSPTLDSPLMKSLHRRSTDSKKPTQSVQRIQKRISDESPDKKKRLYSTISHTRGRSLFTFGS